MKNYNLKSKTFNFLVIVFSFSFLVLPLVARSAALYLLPQSQTVYQGDSFVIEVRLDTEGEEINAIGADLELPTDLLEVIDISSGGSILTLWVEAPVVKEETISFIGGIPRGFEGEGLIGKITFLGKETGEAQVSFIEDSKVFHGEGILTEAIFLEGNYEIIQKPEGLPLISSNTHPDQNKWYNQNTLHLHWDLIDGAEYSFFLSKDSLATPDNVPDKPTGELIWIGDMEYPDLEDGIYYFSLKQKLPNENWSETISFRVMVDIALPEEFKPEIGQDPSIFEGKNFLSFATTDRTSGVDYFEVKEGKEDFKRAKSPYVLEDQSLRSKILVRAIDKAGNEKIAEIIPPKKPFPYGMILVGLVVIGWIIYRFIRKRRQKEIKFI